MSSDFFKDEAQGLSEAILQLLKEAYLDGFSDGYFDGLDDGRFYGVSKVTEEEGEAAWNMSSTKKVWLHED
jgi:hypothetical protein